MDKVLTYSILHVMIYVVIIVNLSERRLTMVPLIHGNVPTGIFRAVAHLMGNPESRIAEDFNTVEEAISCAERLNSVGHPQLLVSYVVYCDNDEERQSNYQFY